MTDPAPPPVPRHTPLRATHEALGASFTDFGGWMMPVRYTSDLAEHHAVRTAAGIFDISHMAEFWVHGGRASEFLDYVLAGRISSMKVGKAKYSLALADDGGIVDDVIVYRTGEQYFVIIANAGNRQAVGSALKAGLAAWARTQRAGDDKPEGDWASISGAEVPRVEDVSDQFALIAVQGPRSREIVGMTDGILVTGTPLDTLAYYAWSEGTFNGSPLMIARTGYTGEDGYELLVPAADAALLWAALTVAGSPLGLVPAGLAARDTLRLEAGMPLYGHELSLDIAPAQAGLGRVVAADKPEFVGKTALEAREADGAQAPVLVGLTSAGKRAGRAGYGVYAGDERVGEVTSGALSPTLGHPIAMAFVAPSAASENTELTIDVRGTRIPATVTNLPFYRRTK